jgi:hypothetical protein
MTIKRCYEPDAEALDRVVEILYRLLVEAPDGSPDGSESAADEVEPSTCVSGESE